MEVHVLKTLIRHPFICLKLPYGNEIKSVTVYILPRNNSHYKQQQSVQQEIVRTHSLITRITLENKNKRSQKVSLSLTIISGNEYSL